MSMPAARPACAPSRHHPRCHSPRRRRVSRSSSTTPSQDLRWRRTVDSIFHPHPRAGRSPLSGMVPPTAYRNTDTDAPAPCLLLPPSQQPNHAKSSPHGFAVAVVVPRSPCASSASYGPACTGTSLYVFRQQLLTRSSIYPPNPNPLSRVFCAPNPRHHTAPPPHVGRMHPAPSHSRRLIDRIPHANANALNA